MEVEILGDLQIRGIRSSLFKIYVLVGPTPYDLFKQMKAITNIDYNPKQYWNMGVHVCKHDVKSLKDSIHELETLLEEENLLQLPFDSHCLQDNLLWLTHNDTALEEAEEVLNLLRSKKKFICSIAVPLEIGTSKAYEEAKSRNLFIITSNTNEIYNGLYQETNVSYIDFSQNNASPWLSEHWVTKISKFISDGYIFQGTWFPDDKNNDGIPEVNKHLCYVSDLLNDTIKHLPAFDVLTPEEKTLLLFKQNILSEIAIKSMTSYLDNSIFYITTMPSFYIPSESVIQGVSASWQDFRKSSFRTLILSIGGLSTGVPVCGDLKISYTTREEQLCIRWYVTYCISLNGN